MFKISTQCYLIKNNKILFLHRTKKENDINKDMYIGVGGKLEENETPLEGIIRETKEEIGVKLVKPQLRGILTFPLIYSEAANSNDYWITFLYTANKWTGEMFKNSNEGGLLWVDKKEISKLLLWDGDKIFLKLLLEDKKFFQLDLIYNKKKLINHKLQIISNDE